MPGSRREDDPSKTNRREPKSKAPKEMYIPDDPVLSVQVFTSQESGTQQQQKARSGDEQDDRDEQNNEFASHAHNDNHTGKWFISDHHASSSSLSKSKSDTTENESREVLVP